MGLPTSYLVSTKNLASILQAIQGAKAPQKFTQSFLEGLGFKAKSDRLLIALLKSLGFLTEGGEPTPRYFDFLDQTQGSLVLAQAIEEAYADLFEVNKEAQKLTSGEVKNKLKTLTQGQYSDSVLGKMASTFSALAALADFQSRPSPEHVKTQLNGAPPKQEQKAFDNETRGGGITLGSLQYVINIQLPESRDQAVYDALFRSLREHLGSE